MAKFTKDDIKLLAKQMRDKKDSDKPFNLLTGAGCSKSAGIPLAGELVKEIHQKFGEECKHHLEEDQMKDYGACMSCLTINDRRALLSKYLDNPKINWAHIAIASLMHAGFVSRVITFNFDSILARACSLLGLYPATYDFAAAATVDTDYIAPQAIIHLHGQGSGKSLLNSDEETKEHAENIRPLIHATFQDSPLLVVGYSGSSDAVFPVIADEYKGRERLWWAGYAENPDIPIANLINKNKKVSYYLAECDADEFLIELAKELQCFPPTLFSDPYGHLLGELEPVAEFPLTKSGSSDILASLKNELLESQQRFNTDQKIPELLMKGEWDKVIELSDPENPDHRELLAWAYVGQGDELAAQAKISTDVSLFNQSFDKYRQAISIKPDMHEAFYNWGIALFDLAELNNNQDLYQQSIDKFQKAIALKPDYHEAYNNWGASLFNLAELNDDEDLYQQSIDKYQQAIAIKPDDHEAFYNWGTTLFNLAELKNDADIYQQSIDRYQRVITIKPDDHEALNNWGRALFNLAELKNDEDIYRQSIEKYQQSIAIKPEMHEAFYNWGNALVYLAKLNDDEALFQQSFDKYQQAITIRSDKHEAFQNWGIALFSAFHLTKSDDYLKKAAEVLEKAEKLKPDAVYNLACLFSVLNEKGKCKEKLLRCRDVKTLPDKAHLREDKDLENVRSEPWFDELINSID